MFHLTFVCFDCRESALLVPEDTERRSSAKHTEHVASILAHELAHQWFGNLVTMKWWDDLWLKEGFATFMSYVALENVCKLLKSQEYLKLISTTFHFRSNRHGDIWSSFQSTNCKRLWKKTRI